MFVIYIDERIEISNLRGAGNGMYLYADDAKLLAIPLMTFHQLWINFLCGFTTANYVQPPTKREHLRSDMRWGSWLVRHCLF